MDSKVIASGIVGLVVGMLFISLFGSSAGYGPWPGRGPMMWGRSGGPVGGLPPVALSEIINRHFTEQMIPHHQLAVDMAELALARAEHTELKELAASIKRDQTAEIETMRAWYRDWYGTDAPEFFGAGMGGFMMGGGMMQGFGSGFDESALEALETSDPFDKKFIEQMIPHHQMAVMMSRMALQRASRDEIKDLARSIIDSQSAEIRQMRDWYAAWYAGK